MRNKLIIGNKYIYHAKDLPLNAPGWSYDGRTCVLEYFGSSNDLAFVRFSEEATMYVGVHRLDPLYENINSNLRKLIDSVACIKYR